MNAPQKVERTLLLAGSKYDVETVSIPAGDGKTTSRAVIRHPGSVIVLPILQVAGEQRSTRIVLIKNYRVTLGRFIIELPAGTRGKPDASGVQESPEVCAVRELEEETGYRARTIKHLTQWLTAPGLTDEVMHLFLATDLTLVGQHLEADETIEPVVVTPERAFLMIDSGDITDAKTILALMWARRAGVV